VHANLPKYGTIATRFDQGSFKTIFLTERNSFPDTVSPQMDGNISAKSKFSMFQSVV
jgi:hypothetical protein